LGLPAPCWNFDEKLVALCSEKERNKREHGPAEVCSLAFLCWQICPKLPFEDLERVTHLTFDGVALELSASAHQRLLISHHLARNHSGIQRIYIFRRS